MKEYQGEKAIISLTSWKARINTVGKTIYSLIKQCPGFHIVLVLSEEEFPKKENELPEDLMLFVKNNLIELLWFYDNIGPHKKYYPTMLKYRDVPIITVDDDYIYPYGFADELFNVHLNNPNSIICNFARGITFKNSQVNSFNNWLHSFNIPASFDTKKLHPIGMGGILYPANCFVFTANFNQQIKDLLYADDILLNILEIQQKKDIVFLRKPRDTFLKEHTPDIMKTGLWTKNSKGRNDNYIKKYEHVFLNVK